MIIIQDLNSNGARHLLETRHKSPLIQVSNLIRSSAYTDSPHSLIAQVASPIPHSSIAQAVSQFLFVKQGYQFFSFA